MKLWFAWALCLIIGHRYRNSVPALHHCEVYCIRCRRSFGRFGTHWCVCCKTAHFKPTEPLKWGGQWR